MAFDDRENIVDFGLESELLEQLIDEGEAFMTSGCAGKTVDCACNRPFGNCTPYQAAQGRWRNFPIPPEESDIVHARRQLLDYDGKEDEEIDPFDDD